MLKTVGDTLESYLRKIEENIRGSRPEWDRHRQWKMAIAEKEPFTKKDMVDYNNQTIRIGSATLESAFNGDRGIELGTLIAYSMLVKCL
ncbi:MAG: hypothetical protein WCP72_09720 [Desulfomonile sp.]